MMSKLAPDGVLEQGIEGGARRRGLRLWCGLHSWLVFAALPGRADGAGMAARSFALATSWSVLGAPPSFGRLVLMTRTALTPTT